MELGKLNRSLVVRAFWRGALLRVLVFILWPFCALALLYSTAPPAVVGAVTAWLTAVAFALRAGVKRSMPRR